MLFLALSLRVCEINTNLKLQGQVDLSGHVTWESVQADQNLKHYKLSFYYLLSFGIAIVLSFLVFLSYSGKSLNLTLIIFSRSFYNWFAAFSTTVRILTTVFSQMYSEEWLSCKWFLAFHTLKRLLTSVNYQVFC